MNTKSLNCLITYIDTCLDEAVSTHLPDDIEKFKLDIQATVNKHPMAENIYIDLYQGHYTIEVDNDDEYMEPGDCGFGFISLLINEHHCTTFNIFYQ